MANYLLGTCSFVFDAGWLFNTNSPALCDIKLFADDPFGSANAHGSPLYPGSYPINQWTSGATSVHRSAVMSDGLRTRCEVVPGFTGFTDPPMGPPYWRSGNYSQHVTFEQGRGLVEPTMVQRSITNPQGRFPMDRLPVRSYHNGLYSLQEAGSLPRGWFIRMRFYNRYNGGNAYAQPLFRFTYSMTLVPGGGGNNCLGAGCRSYPNRHYIADGNDSSPLFFFANSYTNAIYPLNWNLNGYVSDQYRYDFLATSNFISSGAFSGRQIYGTCASSCL